MRMKLIYLILLLVLTTGVTAQTKISGSVKDERGELIPGANVLIQDSYDGTSTGVNGAFTVVTEETGTQTLIVTFVGYKPYSQTLELSGNEIEIQISLKEEINQLDGVVISAGAFTAGEEKRRTILKPVDIATTAGATADIAGALNTLPGTQKVGESGRLFVRGGDGSETRTFIDGMVVLDAYSPSAPNTPSRGRFLPFMFKGTSFSTGGYSAEYGQALSSALVLNSKDIAEMNQTDIGILSVGADVAHTQVWDRASLSGKVQYTNIQPYFELVQQDVDWKKPPVSGEGSLAYRQRTGKEGLFKFFGNFNNTTFSMYNHSIQDPSAKIPYDLDNTYGYGNATFQQPLGKDWSMRTGVSYSFNKNDVTLNEQPLAETENGVHAKAVLEHSASDKLEWRFGGEIINRNYSASRYNDLADVTESLTFLEPLAVAFAEGEYYVNNHFVAKVGGRLEHNNLNKQASLDPRVSLAYKPGKVGQFSLAYGTFRQSSQNQYLRINNRLETEKAEHFILNYQILKDRKTFRIETYYKKYDHLVKYAHENPFQLSNDGYGNAKGIELFWRDNETIRNVDYWVSYSFLDTKRNYLNFPYSSVPSFASTHNFSFVYKHFLTAMKTQVGFTYSYSSGRTYFNPNKPLNEFNSDKTASYQDLSANVAYLPKNNLILYVSCTNLLGRDNIFGYQYSVVPDANGFYPRQPIRQAAPRFLFLGVFITLSKNKSVNQLPNL